jgi:uncharacterized surface protein with fasciclin (FAS1) repeats
MLFFGDAMNKFNLKFSALMVGLALAASSSIAMAAKNIVETAEAAGSFKTLVTAIKAAGLTEASSGKEALTVFAPTDAAFAKIPKADLDALLADKDKLTQVLTLHVVKGEVMAKDVKAGGVTTLGGKTVNISTDKGVMVNNAKVVKADVKASNGVIHAVDSVIMP